jgi:hypothetical protein
VVRSMTNLSMVDLRAAKSEADRADSARVAASFHKNRALSTACPWPRFEAQRVRR